MKREIFRLEYLDARQDGSLRLQDFSMELYEGEILGILIKNASESECLTNLLQGTVNPEKGRILYKGTPLLMKNVRQKTPVSLIDQHSQLIENFTIAENIFVIRKGFRKFIISPGTLEKQTGIMLDRLGISLSPDTIVSKLNPLEKVIIQIVKAYMLHIPAVMLKFPTSFMSDHEIQQLVPHLARFGKLGMAFLIMESTGSLLRQLCSRILIINKGRALWSYEREEFREEILSEILGFREKPLIAEPAESRGRQEILRFADISAGRLSRLNLSARKGEILGLLDPGGKAIEDIRQLCLGSITVEGGEIRIRNRPVPSLSARELIDMKIGFMPENPSVSQIFPDFNALDNLCFNLGGKIPFFWQKFRYKRNILREYAPLFGEGELLMPVKELSPAAILRLSYIRWYIYSPDLLILHKPFSSIDRNLEELTIRMMNLLLKKEIGLLILAANEWELSSVSEKLPVRIQRITTRL